MGSDKRKRVKGVCLLTSKKGSMNDIIKVLQSIPEVTEIISVTGDADIICHIEVDMTDQLHDIYADIIDQIPGVLNTKTYIVMREFKL